MRRRPPRSPLYVSARRSRNCRSDLFLAATAFETASTIFASVTLPSLSRHVLFDGGCPPVREAHLPLPATSLIPSTLLAAGYSQALQASHPDAGPLFSHPMYLFFPSLCCGRDAAAGQCQSTGTGAPKVPTTVQTERAGGALTLRPYSTSRASLPAKRTQLFLSKLPSPTSVPFFLPCDLNFFPPSSQLVSLFSNNHFVLG